MDDVHIGISDFDKLIREGYAFVDKTLMIRNSIEDGAAVNLITRPIMPSATSTPGVHE